MFGIVDAGGSVPLGVLIMLAYLAVGVGGFVLIACGLMSVTERLMASRDRDLEDLRRGYQAGEINGPEFEARRRRLAAR